ncbi:hypothetical protein GALMADRAFT_52867, partial [Galerina marginata CBS 339.88]
LGFIGESENSDSDSDSDSEESEASSDSDQEDYDYKRKRKEKYRRKHKPRQKDKHHKTSRLPQFEEDRTHKVNVPPEEIEGMIQQLNTMSLEDPKYGQMYFKVLQLDTTGIAEKCIRRLPFQ